MLVGNNQSRAQLEGGGGYYSNRGSRMALDRPDSYVDGYGAQPQHGQGRPVRQHPRMNSEPMLYGNGKQPANLYVHGYHQSHDTVTSGTGSHQTEPWGNSTDPSSENSSVDRINTIPKANEPSSLAEGYGMIGFGGNQQYQLEEYGVPQQPQSAYGRGHGNGPAGPTGQMGSQGMARYQNMPQDSRPLPPPKEVRRAPIKLDAPPGSALTRQESRQSSTGGKRKSWFKRRFSTLR